MTSTSRSAQGQFAWPLGAHPPSPAVLCPSLRGSFPLYLLQIQSPGWTSYTSQSREPSPSGRNRGSLCPPGPNSWHHSVNGPGGIPLLKKMREKESRCHTQGFKKIPMSSKQSYHMQLEPRPSGLVTCPNWWPPLALFLPPSLGQWHPCQQLRAACLYHLQHS